MVVKRLRVAEQYDSYAKAIRLETAPPEVRREVRRAFYGGAAAMLYIVVAGLSPGEEATAEDVQSLVEVREELQAFGESVKAGRV